MAADAAILSGAGRPTGQTVQDIQRASKPRIRLSLPADPPQGGLTLGPSAPTKVNPANVRLAGTDITPRQFATANGILVKKGLPPIADVTKLTPAQQMLIDEVKAGRAAGEVAFKAGKTSQ